MKNEGSKAFVFLEVGRRSDSRYRAMFTVSGNRSVGFYPGLRSRIRLPGATYMLPLRGSARPSLSDFEWHPFPSWSMDFAARWQSPRQSMFDRALSSTPYGPS